MSFAHTKRVKTHVAHWCAGCLIDIPIGSTVTCMTGVWDGNFVTSYLCDPCQDFLDTHPDYPDDDCWYEGDIGEARREEAQT